MPRAGGRRYSVRACNKGDRHRAERGNAGLGLWLGQIDYLEGKEHRATRAGSPSPIPDYDLFRMLWQFEPRCRAGLE